MAALAVTIFHFTLNLPEDFWAKQIGQWGYLGVQVFFIISGVVIPYSMWKSNYHLRNIGGFMLKRIVRIDPPYFACIIMIIGLRYITTLTPWYKGPSFGIDFENILCHIGYINAFTGKPWLNVVFWTLAIEFQFYILIALLFPLIVSKRIYIWGGAILALNVFPFLFDTPAFIFKYLSFFSIGILIFRNKVGFENNKTTYLLILFLLLLIFVNERKIEEVIAACIPVGFIYFIELKTRILEFFGEISYSLYLIHAPIGATIQSFSSKFIPDQPWPKLGVSIFAMVSCIAFAYFFYHFIEKPAKRWSKKIAYSGNVVGA